MDLPETNTQAYDLRCPVTLEEFTSQNPPFKLDFCGHRLSLTALQGLPAEKFISPVNVNVCVVVQYCPICKQRILFAVLDDIFLDLHKWQKERKLMTNSNVQMKFYAPDQGIFHMAQLLGCRINLVT